MAKRQQEARTYNISVVGLSGTECEKGDVGIGKSCLCNRFMYALAQDYHTDHISVLSQSDFNGRVINNDHFLYWGATSKREDGADYAFNVIEQTEFVDDASFQPFRTGRIETYSKRCVSLKVHSDEKLMYICKGQLGMETDTAYVQKLMPERLAVDGFLCLFDVSTVPHRSFDKQLEITVAILNNIVKIRKPVVLVTTKNDCAEERYMREAEKLLARKEFKGTSIPLVETSAHENVNIDLAFLAIAHLIDKMKTKLKIVPFKEAWRARREIMDVAKDAYVHMLQSEITDYKSQWSVYRRKFEASPDFVHYRDLWGVNSAKKVFQQHTRKMREELIRHRERNYLSQLPDIFKKLLPSLGVIADRSWPSCMRYLEHHQDYERYFVDISSDTSSWKDTDFVDDSDELRIPFDLLRDENAEGCFRSHVALLQNEYRKLELKRQFWQLLKDSPHVTPGKPLTEAYIFFVGKDCFNNLDVDDRQLVYDQYQEELKVVAYDDLQELLWEHSHMFMKINPASRLTNDDFKQLTLTLEDDPRFKRLNCLEQDRKVRLLNHLGFMQCPSKERCYFRLNCIDYSTDELINKDSSRSSFHERPDSPSLTERPLNLVLLGEDTLAFEVNKEIRVLCPEDEYAYNSTVYSLDYRPIDGDVSLDQNAFTTANFKPDGCLCVYSTAQSIDYITSSLEFCMRWELTHDEDTSIHSTPIIIMPASNTSLSDKDREALRERGGQLANRMQCEFIDNPVNDDLMDGRLFSATQIERALQCVIRGYNSVIDLQRLNIDNAAADLRVTFCLMCGDPFCLDTPLSPLLQQESARPLAGIPSTLLLDTFLDDTKQTVEVAFCSYHRAATAKSPFCHGYVLVYSAKRRASFATMRAFANTLPRLPILILAITDNGGTSTFFTDELVQNLIQEGNALADEIGIHFIASTTNFHSQTAVYMPFLMEAWKRRHHTESLYSLIAADDASPPPYEKSPMDRRPPMTIPPVPPVPLPPNVYPTHRSSASNSTEDSEPLYERPGPRTQSDSEPERPSSTSPPPSTNTSPYAVSAVLYSSIEGHGESLVKPSQLKNRRNLYAEQLREVFRNSYPAADSNPSHYKTLAISRKCPSVDTMVVKNTEYSGKCVSTPPQKSVNNSPDLSGSSSHNSGLYSVRKSGIMSPMRAALHSPIKVLQSPVRVYHSPIKMGVKSPVKGGCQSTSGDRVYSLGRARVHSPVGKPPQAGASEGRARGAVNQVTPGKDASRFAEFGILQSLENTPRRDNCRYSERIPVWKKGRTPSAIVCGDYAITKPCLSGSSASSPKRGNDSACVSKSSKGNAVASNREDNSAVKSVQGEDNLHRSVKGDYSTPGDRPLEGDNSSPKRGGASVDKTGERDLSGSPKRGGNTFATVVKTCDEAPSPMKSSKHCSLIAPCQVAPTECPHVPEGARHSPQRPVMRRGLGTIKSESFKRAIQNSAEAWAVHEHHHDQQMTDDAVGVKPRPPATSGEWLVNSLYSSSDPKAAENWHNSSMYGTGGLGGANMDEWMDNSIYESTDDRVPMPVPKPLDMSKYSHLADAATRNTPGARKATAPLALPEKIEIGDYAIVKDMVHENDYALVQDALPADPSDTDSDQSGQDQDVKARDMYARANRKPTPHKKKYKARSRESGGGEEGTTGDYRLVLSQSASEGSDGTADEVLNSNQKRPSLRSRKTRSSSGAIEPGASLYSPQFYDSDYPVSPPITSVSRLDDEESSAYEVVTPQDDKLMVSRMVSVEEDTELGVLGKTKIRLRSMSKDPAEKLRKKEKEERKVKEQERRKEKKKIKEDTKRRYKKKDGKSTSLLGGDLTDHIPSVNNVHLPLFIEKCIEYIEEEGMQVEGLYRVPGNRAHVEMLIQNFKEDPSVDICCLDIQVNAVATALKSFFSDLTESLIPHTLNEEFFEAARIPEKSCRLVSIRGVLKKLPTPHYEVLKYLVTHLTKVSRNSSTNSMDCRNLAVCWWPTLIRHDIASLQKMSEISSISVEIIYMLIEQSGFLFYKMDEV